MSLALTRSAVVFLDTTSSLFYSPGGVNGVTSNESRVETYLGILGARSTPPSARRLRFSHASSRGAVHGRVVVYEPIGFRPVKRETRDTYGTVVSTGTHR